MGKKQNDYVSIPLEDTDMYEVNILRFNCPNCAIVTKRKRIGRLIETITCKCCKKSYKLHYGEDCDIMTCIFCQYVYTDSYNDVPKCPKCKTTTQLNKSKTPFK